MKRFSNILLAIDTRLDPGPLVDTVVRAATHADAHVTVLDTVPDVSWLARMLSGSIEDLRTTTRTAVEDRLLAIVDTLKGHGISADMRVRDGEAAVAIVREAIEHDLVVASAQGLTSKVAGSFGLTARRLVRHCPAPLWLVPDGAGTAPTHIAACLDTASDDPVDQELNDKAFGVAAALAAEYGATLHVIHAWRLRDEAMLSTQLPADVIAKYAKEHLAWRRRRLDAFLEAHPVGLPVEQHVLEAEPYDAVPAAVKAHGIDLVVLGTVGRSGVTGLVMGNTAESILDRLEVGVLALKPSSFRPILDPR